MKVMKPSTFLMFVFKNNCTNFTSNSSYQNFDYYLKQNSLNCDIASRYWTEENFKIRVLYG